MCNATKALRFLLLLCLLNPVARAADEYLGQFESELDPNRDNMDKVVFSPARRQCPFAVPAGVEKGANVTCAQLYNPNNEKAEVAAWLIEPSDGDPYVCADANLNKAFDADEKVVLAKAEDDNPYIWQGIVKIALQKGSYKTFPLFLQYFREVKWDNMADEDRLVLQSSEVYARGSVDVAGKKMLVAYGYNPRERKIVLSRANIGMDCNGDGKIDWGRFSAEAAMAEDDTVVFRAGDVYLSNKRADIDKNAIVLRSHPASDYKRVELKVGDEFPAFEFKDFQGKKRSLAEFRGKYVLLDFWAIWCGPCRREMPYQKAAYRNFNAKGFEILGLNADEADYISQVKNWLAENNLNWTQATRESINPLMKSLRIHLFPTTLLLDREGKILSLDERKKDQLELRGKDLLESLQKVFAPPVAASSGTAARTAGNQTKADSNGMVSVGNVKLTPPPPGFSWKASSKLRMYCAVPDNWKYEEDSTGDGLLITISEPASDGDIEVVTIVQTKVAGNLEELAKTKLDQLTEGKQVVGKEEFPQGDQVQYMRIVQEGRSLTFHSIVINKRTKSLRHGQFTCPMDRLEKAGQTAQTAMGMMLMFEN